MGCVRNVYLHPGIRLWTSETIVATRSSGNEDSTCIFIGRQNHIKFQRKLKEKSCWKAIYTISAIAIPFLTDINIPVLMTSMPETKQSVVGREWNTNANAFD